MSVRADGGAERQLRRLRVAMSVLLTRALSVITLVKGKLEEVDLGLGPDGKVDVIISEWVRSCRQLVAPNLSSPAA